EDLVLRLEEVDEVAQGGLHLANLVLHARADVEGERDAERSPFAAEVGDLLLLAVLLDLEVLASQSHDRMPGLVEQGDGHAYRARAGAEGGPVHAAGGGGEAADV